MEDDEKTTLPQPPLGLLGPFLSSIVLWPPQLPLFDLRESPDKRTGREVKGIRSHLRTGRLSPLSRPIRHSYVVRTRKDSDFSYYIKSGHVMTLYLTPVVGTVHEPPNRIRKTIEGPGSRPVNGKDPKSMDILLFTHTTWGRSLDLPYSLFIWNCKIFILYKLCT